MNRRSLAGLFISSLVGYSFGNGFLPLMPLYAQKFGATSEMAGYYIALAYVFLAAGTFLGGRLSDAIENRPALLAGCGFLLVPLTWMLGVVQNIWQLALVNGVQWFVLGACLAVIGAIAGKEARAEERGRVFGILGTTISLGSLAGGLTVGRMTDVLGYSAMLSIMAGFILLIPAAALFAVQETPSAPAVTTVSKPLSLEPLFTSAFVLLLLAEILTMVSNAEGNMGRSVAMSGAPFNGTAVTTTAAVGGVVALPLPFFIGWLSDRVGRKPIMIAGPVFGAASLLVLLVSRSFWEFCGVAVLNSLMVVNVTVGPAMVADVVRRERVGTGISFFQSSVWIGMIIGFSTSGVAFQHLGMQLALEFGAVCSLLAVPLFLLLRSARKVHGDELAPATA